MRSHTTHHAAAVEFNSTEEAERLKRDLQRHANHARQITQQRGEIDRLRADVEALRAEKQGLLDMQAAMARLRRRLEEKSPRDIEDADL